MTYRALSSSGNADEPAPDPTVCHQDWYVHGQPQDWSRGRRGRIYIKKDKDAL